ncbi:hypothetical protein SteCoe_31047 [Stentor coeruleus]|uniref:Uncharacterized protein n=1 Tax=Stentor coeruleus TaxID=5963 RepID=A0A1R2B2B3_9CILI|nr:hypothetical protein SteCoe_31047 [Stentor coeruleus]
MKPKAESISKPDYHLNLIFEQSQIKQSKSCQNSPKIFAETTLNEFPCFPSIKEENEVPNRSHGNLKSYSSAGKIKALEEIGLFSEFKSTKNRIIPCGVKAKKFRRTTIHITDFMMEGNKRNLLKSAGGVDLYLDKRRKYEKELILHDTNMRNFFEHSEKKPEFFLTPPISPHISPTISVRTPRSRDELRNYMEKVPDIDQIIEKCDEAIMLKPPKILAKSISPRNNKEKPKSEMSRMRLKFCQHFRQV